MTIDKRFILERLCERSTWMGIASIFGAFHYKFTEIEFDSFVTLMAGIFGAIAAFFPASPPKKED